MELIFKQDQFEGPLDLMLHLIKQNKLDLFNLDLDILINQYIDYMHKLEKNHLEIAGEYIVQLSGLIELKSKRLLPNMKENSDSVEENTEEKLVKRLLEYQRFKEASLDLSQRFIERQQQFSKISKPQTNEVVVYQHQVYDLVKAMMRVLDRQQHFEIKDAILKPQDFSIDDQIDHLKKIFRHNKKISFNDLISENKSVDYKIVTFLAILDLIWQQEIDFILDGDDIILRSSSYDERS